MPVAFTPVRPARELRHGRGWGLVPEDDMFHPPESADPWWTETVWFSWMVPERNLLGYWYTVMRANIGVNVRWRAGLRRHRGAAVGDPGVRLALA